MADTMPLDAALAALPEGDDIHTFRDGGGILIGADWSRADIVERLTAAETIHVTGGMAQGMKHGMAIYDDHGPLFIETAGRTDEEAEQARKDTR